MKGPSPQHYLECHYFQEAEDSDSVSSPPHMPASATLSLYAVSSSPGTCSSGDFQAKRCLWFCRSGARLDGKGLVRVRQPILLAHVKGHFYRAWNPHIARIALPERMWLLTAESSRVPDPKESQGTPKPLNLQESMLFLQSSCITLTCILHTVQELQEDPLGNTEPGILCVLLLTNQLRTTPREKPGRDLVKP